MTREEAQEKANEINNACMQKVCRNRFNGNDDDFEQWCLGERCMRFEQAKITDSSDNHYQVVGFGGCLDNRDSDAINALADIMWNKFS